MSLTPAKANGVRNQHPDVKQKLTAYALKADLVELLSAGQTKRNNYGPDPSSRCQETSNGSAPLVVICTDAGSRYCSTGVGTTKTK